MWDTIKNDPILKTVSIVILSVLGFGFAFNIMFGASTGMDNQGVMGGNGNMSGNNSYSMAGNAGIFGGLTGLFSILLGMLLFISVIGLFIGLIMYIRQKYSKEITAWLSSTRHGREEASKTLVCESCGSRLKDEWKCCPNCGSEKGASLNAPPV